MDSSGSTLSMDNQAIRRYFKGEALYGDDLSPEGILQWFTDEQEAYAQLANEDNPDIQNQDRDEYEYGYHALNQLLGYSHLPKGKKYNHVLSLGGAFGDELLPLQGRMNEITIVEPSEAFGQGGYLGRAPITYLKPRPDAKIELPEASVDLITCFGTLHHIPNVSAVMAEMARVLVPGGHALIREPIVSMGDWRKPRNGLTRHERGIPLKVFRKMIADSGLTVQKETLCGFPLTFRLRDWCRVPIFSRRDVVRWDVLLCRLTRWNYRYHSNNALLKLRPTLAFYVLQKPK
jgi:SAM-dependent methyltransferase